ncbi:unnamed protein product, partial [Ectocarpus sp. 8 AP-2014]
FRPLPASKRSGRASESVVGGGVVLVSCLLRPSFCNLCVFVVSNGANNWNVRAIEAREGGGKARQRSQRTLFSPTTRTICSEDHVVLTLSPFLFLAGGGLCALSLFQASP